MTEAAIRTHTVANTLQEQIAAKRTAQDIPTADMLRDTLWKAVAFPTMVLRPRPEVD